MHAQPLDPASPGIITSPRGTRGTTPDPDAVAEKHRVPRPGRRARTTLRGQFADPELHARALASTGPAFEAIQNAGQAEFHRAAAEQAQQQPRHGLPPRAENNVVGYLARKPGGAEPA